MDDLNPPLLKAIRHVRWRIRAGESMKDAFESYLKDTGDELARDLRGRWRKNEHAAPSEPLRSFLAQSFWDLVERGLAGQPIGAALDALTAECESTAELELESHLSELPFKLLIPLLLFQFPAYLVLLLGPLLRELNRNMGA